ncbi:zinc finger MYM-type protein 1-like [Bacillus rossius redtenbacheri]|uniref:zinc finger MYM-type protein 1-like n=1 Tax=Bacillus rossius redtenbacheri TaxID=93214 RepID=UPI002FDD14BC
MHNEKVRKNRRIVSHLIRATCFLAKQELAFRGHDESTLSLNKGNYIEFLNELAEYDNELKAHLENSTVFTGLSSDIQNDILFSLSDLLIREVKKEISESPFVALILDETTDISVKSQLSSVLRYVTRNGDVEERFLKFVDVSDDRTANGLYQHAIQILEDFKCVDKLVAQTYDGAAVMAGEHGGLQTKLRAVCDQAIFVHCYAHKLNLVLSQSVSYIKQCKVFFISLTAFGSFFGKSTKRMQALDAEVKKRFPALAPTRWNYNSKLVETVNEHKENIADLLRAMIENADKWDSETLCSARGLLSHLNDFDFNFFLVIFSYIFPHSDSIFQILQTKISDINFCMKKIENFKTFLNDFRNDFDRVWGNVCSECENTLPTAKRARVDFSSGEDRKVIYRRLFFQIVDAIIVHVNQRFSEVPKLKFVSLLDRKLFLQHSQNFPEEAFVSLKKNYGKFFDLPSLRSELYVLFTDSDMHKCTVSDFQLYLVASELSDVFPETLKLSKLILTMPATSASAERSFSALKRIKDYLRNSQRQERLSALALLSIEKKLLQKLRRGSSFNDDVIDIFATKNRRIELKYKI